MFIRGRPITMYIPSNIQNYDELKMEPPSERLELDWVYPSIMPRSCEGCYIQTLLVLPGLMPRMVYIGLVFLKEEWAVFSCDGVGAMVIAGLLELKQGSATQFCVWFVSFLYLVVTLTLFC